LSLPISFSCGDFDPPVDGLACDAITNKITGILIAKGASNKWEKIVLRLILAIVIIAGGGWMLAFAINLAAFEASPATVAKFECPPGSTIKSEYVQLRYNQPGEKSYTFRYLDQNGHLVPTLPKEQISSAEYRYVYTAGILIVTALVLVWYAVFLAIKRL
jgi:hypothetical protein